MMDCEILGKSLNLSGLRLLICKIGMLPASLPTHFFQQLSIDTHYLLGSVLGAEGTAVSRTAHGVYSQEGLETCEMKLTDKPMSIFTGV